MTQNIYKALVRSFTPWVISGIVYLVTHLGYHISMVTATEVAAIIGTLLTLGAHVLEVKWPAFGVFLGWIGAPAYVPVTTKATLQAQINALLSTNNPPLVPTSVPAPVVAPVVNQVPAPVTVGSTSTAL